MRKAHDTPRGTLHRLVLDCRLLDGNLQGDPTEREVHVYVPAGHDGAGLPLLVDIVGYTAGGPAHTNWRAFGENVPERLDRLIAAGEMPPVVVAFPDCFTRLGGNQYVNSAALGPWMDVICQEMVPFVERQFGCGGPGRRGIFGKSSGGYGAMAHALLRPDFWAAAACHSGDVAFEWCYLPEFPGVLRALAKHDLGIEGFMRKFESARKPDGKDTHVLMMLCMAATYDPDPKAYLGIRLPVDLETCEIIPERWAAWLDWDPLMLLEKHADGLRDLKALYIDCGDRDQYNLVYGARRLHRRLEALGIKHRYEEFPDDHSGVDYRMDESLPFLAKALSA
ncbi:enterochelin esterase [Aerophototrophica crusticola]|uniref:Enterochelin esterase n=1 Tax=Aerophototrophica crusticola TaxID=1709002 RepID=A0A858RAT4_9PROT|nr:enterochelin esterase [Rhodospirillaceae bacterium B3]